MHEQGRRKYRHTDKEARRANHENSVDTAQYLQTLPTVKRFPPGRKTTTKIDNVQQTISLEGAFSSCPPYGVFIHRGIDLIGGIPTTPASSVSAFTCSHSKFLAYNVFPAMSKRSLCEEDTMHTKPNSRLLPLPRPELHSAHLGWPMTRLCRRMPYKTSQDASRNSVTLRIAHRLRTAKIKTKRAGCRGYDVVRQTTATYQRKRMIPPVYVDTFV